MSKAGGGSTVLWWVGWIVLTIVTFFISAWFWTGFIAERVGNMQKPGVPVLWVTAVFGSWIVLLVPLIIVMYSKVDKAYEDARIARETSQFNRARQEFRVKSVLIEEPKRLLSRTLSEKLKRVPETIRRGHLVTAVLNDGRRVENVFILNRRDVLGVYGEHAGPLEARDIADLEPVAAERIPDFKTEHWLRFDGVGAPAA
jgi:hypothetical protein